MSGVGVLFNPKAGRHKRESSLVGALQKRAASDVLVIGAGEERALLDAAASLHAKNVAVIAISGGDGTAGRVVTALETVYGTKLPPIALLRGGTMNTTANAVGVRRRTPAALLERVVKATRDGETLPLTPRGTMRVEGRLGFLFGVGVVAGYLRAYYAAGANGPLSGAEVLARGIASTAVGGTYVRTMAERVACEVSFDDGTTWPMRDYLSVAAGTIDQIGLGFRPFSRAKEDPSRFHLLGIHTTPMGFVADLPRVWAAAGMTPSRADERLVRRAVLRFDRAAMGYMLDGDLETVAGDTLAVASGPVVQMVTG